MDHSRAARVDRIACPWLITASSTPTPEFLFVPADAGPGAPSARAPSPMTSRRRARSPRHRLLVRRVPRAVRPHRSGPGRAGADRARRRHDHRALAGVRGPLPRPRASRRSPGRPRQYGAPVPDVRRPLRLLPAAGGGAARHAGAVRLPAWRGEERGRRGALPAARGRARLQDGRRAAGTEPDPALRRGP